MIEQPEHRQIKAARDHSIRAGRNLIKKLAPSLTDAKCQTQTCRIEVVQKKKPPEGGSSFKPDDGGSGGHHCGL
jgi:hypothetical protein